MASKMSNKSAEYLIKLFVTIILLSILLSRIKINLMFDSLNEIAISVLIGSIMINFLAVFVNSIKWKLLLWEIPIIKLLKLNLISQYYSILFPGQMVGEVAKAYILGKNKQNAERIAASVFLDKITGFIASSIIGLIGIFFSNADKLLLRYIALLLLILLIICIVLIFSVRISMFYQAVVKMLYLLKNRFNRITRILDLVLGVMNSWHIYSNNIIVLFKSVIFGLAYQILGIVICVILGKELGVNVAFVDWCWILGLLSVILLLPVTIGGLGIREGSLIGILSIFKVSNEKALALSFSLFGLQITLAIVGGALELIRQRRHITLIKV
jgi:hypothetical protein